MSRTALAVVAVALFAVAPAVASEQRPTQGELEGEIVCPTCNTTLDHSDAPIAQRMKAVIAQRIAAGDTKSEIKDALVAEFGTSVLAAPPKAGFNLLAWLVPLGGLVVGAIAAAVLAWRSSRARGGGDDADTTSTTGRAPLEADLERRVDVELARFDA